MVVWRGLFGVALVTALVAAFQTQLPGVTPVRAETITVTRTDDPDPDVDLCASNGCTLREAILAVGAGDTISFNIDGTEPHTISVEKALPPVTGTGVTSVTIDGYTQPGASPNTAGPWQPGNAVIKIILDGSMIEPNDPGGHTGLWISASGTTIKGLSIVNFADEGIKTGTFPSSVVIRGNYIGIEPNGTVGPNRQGINLRSSQSGNAIGGLNPADRNVVSGNVEEGMWLNGSTAAQVANNFVGTDASGTVAVPNGGHGIHVAGAPGSVVGGSTPAAGNLVSGNGGSGIALTTTDAYNINVKGNRIGTAIGGETGLGNGMHGVLLDTGAHDNTLGGEFNVNEQNIIAFNGDAGVALTAAAGINNYIDPSVTHSNGGLGTDLKIDGVSLNDPGDLDLGPNSMMNYPTVESAIYNGSTLVVRGSMEGPVDGYNVFIFSNEECDATGSGEGKTFLGAVGVRITAPGPRTFQRTFFNFVPGDEMIITMSASDPESTSEFSLCKDIEIQAFSGTPTASPTPTVSPTPTATPTATPTPTPSPTLTASPTPTGTPPPVPLNGDVTCDGSVNAHDALAILAYAAEIDGAAQPAGVCPDIEEPVGENIVGDTDCDDNVGPRDALRVLLHIVGADLPGVPAGCPAIGEPLDN